jgi:hypothetical protein
MRPTQDANVVAGHALRNAEEVLKVTDTELSLREEPDDAETCRVSQNLEQLCELAELWLPGSYRHHRYRWLSLGLTHIDIVATKLASGKPVPPMLRRAVIVLDPVPIAWIRTTNAAYAACARRGRALSRRRRQQHGKKSPGVVQGLLINRGVRLDVQANPVSGQPVLDRPGLHSS